MPFTQTMPKLSPTMEAGMIAKWHKKEGDKVDSGDLLIEVATDKATVEFNAIDSGFLRKIIVPEGKEAQVNQAIAIFTENKGESIEGYKPEGIEASQAEVPLPEVVPQETKVAVPEPKPIVKEAPPPAEKGRMLASPLAKRIAKERNLDLTTAKGTGPSGRIMSRDLDKIQSQSSRVTPSIAAGSFELETLTPMRRVIAQRLQESKSTIPHFYVTQVVDAEPLTALREQLRQFEQKVTINDLVLRATALCLREYPNVNSGYDASKQAIIRFQTVDVSVAVSIEAGLITPIVRHADYKSVSELSSEVRQLATRAKEGKLQENEYKGGSFTLSNMGMYGISDFAAIINPPQAAILAVSGIQDAPVIRQGQVVPGKTMALTLSVDHRVIDGVAASQFIKTLQKLLENPAILLL